MTVWKIYSLNLSRTLSSSGPFPREKIEDGFSVFKRTVVIMQGSAGLSY